MSHESRAYDPSVAARRRHLPSKAGEEYMSGARDNGMPPHTHACSTYSYGPCAFTMSTRWSLMRWPSRVLFR